MSNKYLRPRSKSSSKLNEEEPDRDDELLLVCCCCCGERESNVVTEGGISCCSPLDLTSSSTKLDVLSTTNSNSHTRTTKLLGRRIRLIAAQRLNQSVSASITHMCTTTLDSSSSYYYFIWRITVLFWDFFKLTHLQFLCVCYFFISLFRFRFC